MDEALRAELLARVARGREAFAAVERLMSTDAKFGADLTAKSASGLPLVLLEWPEAPQAFHAMVAVDAANSRWLVDLLEARGWPGTSNVGDDVAAAVWELAMHADTEQEARTRWLALVEEAAAVGDVPLEHARLLQMRRDAVAALTD